MKAAIRRTIAYAGIAAGAAAAAPAAIPA